MHSSVCTSSISENHRLNASVLTWGRILPAISSQIPRKLCSIVTLSTVRMQPVMFYSQCRPHPLSRNGFDFQVATRREKKMGYRSNQQSVNGLQSLSKGTSKSHPVRRDQFIINMPNGTSTEPK